MAQDTPGPKAGTWKPEGSAYSVRSVEKGRVGHAQRRQRFLMGFGLQVLLVVVLLASAFIARRDTQTLLLYLWTLVLPVGFGGVYLATYRQGERERAARTWTPEGERAAAKRAYTRMGFTIGAWVVGIALIFYVV